MSSQHDYAMEELRAQAARKIEAALTAHLEHLRSENLQRLYPYNTGVVETAARITESLANALAVVAK